MKRILKAFIKENYGHVLVEAMIALILAGTVTCYVINNSIMPGLKAKWDIMNNTIQNNWIN